MRGIDQGQAVQHGPARDEAALRGLTHGFFAMGCDCAVHLAARDDGDLAPVALAAEAEVRRIEARYSRFRPDSALSEINRQAQAGGTLTVDPETAGLIAYAKAIFAKSDGAFDITSGVLRSAWNFETSTPPTPEALARLLPNVGLEHVGLDGDRLTFARSGLALDLGGLGKEYAADRAAEVCQALGARSGFVDLAGDIRIIGPQPDGRPWIIGVRHPRRPDALIAKVPLWAGALATSGDYERFMEVAGRRHGHILDPRTGWPARGVCSVTVLADDCLNAGALATAALVMGPDAGRWLAALGVEHILVDEAQVCAASEGLRSNLLV
ncbi:MAG: FAD:protein FMN transferase [bacterium]|nr:FAD:protein FMN transferase [bacterium]